jgi:threonine dehydrogenase-like Zn-dependent dehydrogenase
VGETVAVSGLGIIGLFIAHLAARTAGRLVLIEPDPWRRARASFLGADAVVAPADAPAAIAAATGGRGVDLHFEASGAPLALRAALVGLAREGTVAVASNFGTKPVELFLSPEFHNRRLRIISSQAGSINAELLPRWSRGRRMAVAIEQLRRHDFSGLVTHRVPLADAAFAYRMLDQPDGDVLGVLLTYPEA